MAYGLLFPGQGSQAVGMGKSLADNFSVARDVFAEVDDVLGRHLSHTMFAGPAEELTRTVNAQPALMAVSVAASRVCAEESDIVARCAAVAGHSLGEYSALVAAGALDLADAARLLHMRGAAMQRAVPEGEGAMAAILGLELAGVEAVIAAAGGGGVCEIANDNAPGQVVISGQRAAVGDVAEYAKSQGASRVMMLPVSAPFHSSLMAPAEDVLRPALMEVSGRDPVYPVYANVTARAVSEWTVCRDLLIAQICARVRWRESMLAMVAGEGDNLEIETFFELGSGKVLRGLMKRIAGGVNFVSIGTSDDIKSWLNRPGGHESS